MSAKSLLAAGFCLLYLAVAPCLGTTRTWVGGSSTPGYEDWWLAETNWTPTGAPLDSDVLLVASGSPYIGKLSKPFATSGSGSITMSGPAVVDCDYDVWVGVGFSTPYPGPGTLRIEKGAYMSLDVASEGVHLGGKARVGYGSSGTLIVTGSNSVLDMPLGTVILGDAWSITGPGAGDLQILNGGKLYADKLVAGTGARGLGTSGTITLSGATSLLDLQLGCDIADACSGTMSVSGGATLDTTALTIGCNEGAGGTVTVNGGQVNVVNLTVGKNGSGLLTIQGVGAVAVDQNVGTAIIGAGSTGDGRVVVDGKGSLLNAYSTSPLCIGQQVNGVLEVRNGGKVNTRSVAVDTSAGTYTGPKKLDHDFRLNVV